LEDDPGDFWVDVLMKVSTPTGSWTFGGECLDYDEVGMLAEWLQAVGNRAEVQTWVKFTEPDFSLRVLESSEDLVTLRVYFEFRGRPPWSPDESTGRGEVWIDLEMLRHDLVEAGATLKKEASKLPPVGSPTNTGKS
jgi:hypothetical protein